MKFKDSVSIEHGKMACNIIMITNNLNILNVPYKRDKYSYKYLTRPANFLFYYICSKLNYANLYILLHAAFHFQHKVKNQKWRLECLTLMSNDTN